MIVNLQQLSKMACLLEDADTDVVSVTETPTHAIDRTVIARVEGRPHVIDQAGHELPAGDYVFGHLARAAA